MLAREFDFPGDREIDPRAGATVARSTCCAGFCHRVVTDPCDCSPLASGAMNVTALLRLAPARRSAGAASSRGRSGAFGAVQASGRSRARTCTSRSPFSAPAGGRARRDRRRAAGGGCRRRSGSAHAVAVTARRGASACSSFDDEERPGGRVSPGSPGPARAARRVRARAPDVASARHRAPLSRAAAARPALPGAGAVRAVRRGCLPFRAAPGRGAVRRPRIGCR